jgi:malate dehydrogenase (oxaloacetate-decarboxylating)
MAQVIATGRSDFPNQVNNVLCFPGLFRGALDAGATAITEEMKIVAARAIASVIPDDQLNEDYILPSVFNEDVAKLVADAVAKEAKRSGHVRGPGSARIYI